jgi:hypothetical protein
MNDDFKEEFINTSQSKEEFGWSLIEGILEMYLFRVYDFNSVVGALLSFFPLVLLPVSACNNTRRPLNNNDGRLLKSAFVSFQQKRLVVIL